jgi:hypothetical protein
LVRAYGSVHGVAVVDGWEGGRSVSLFEGKKVVVLGERDGIAGPAIAACVEAAGGEVAFIATECFV